MATINMTAADLAAVLEGGAINPDIMQQIMDVSKLPLEFTNRCGTTSQSNPYKEWMMDRYQAQDLDNAFVDGQDIDEQNQGVISSLRNSGMTPLVALGFLVFTLLYTPCLATVAAIKRETGTWAYIFFSIAYSLGLAYTLAFAINYFGGMFNWLS